MTFIPNSESINKPNYEILEDLTQISPAQLQTLIEKLQTESAILTERLCVKDFQKLIEKNLLTAIVDVDQNIIATAMLWEVECKANWFEMGTVWVSPYHRGQKLGHKVFQAITDKIPDGSNAFLLTATPQIVHSAQTFGYKYMKKDLFEETLSAIEPPAESQHQLYTLHKPKKSSTSDNLKNQRQKQYDK
jgi:predicted N-acetyltransferase YhbS